MMRGLSTFVLIISIHALTAAVSHVSYEFENALSDEQNLWAWRSAASGNKTLRLVDEEGIYRVSLTFCLQKKVPGEDLSLSIDNITYTNDGPKDLVMMDFDGSNFANWTTYERCASGFEWNRPKVSGQQGGVMTLSEGNHTLTISLLTDEYGAEMDKIDLTLDNQSPDQEIICSAEVSVSTS